MESYSSLEGEECQRERKAKSNFINTARTDNQATGIRQHRQQRGLLLPHAAAAPAISQQLRMQSMYGEACEVEEGDEIAHDMLQ